MPGDQLVGQADDLESTMLRHFLRLSRLTLAVALLYIWFISSGDHIIHMGERHLVDWKERRDLSLFQISVRFLERRFINGLSRKIQLCEYL